MEKMSNKENVALIKCRAKFYVNFATFFSRDILFCISARVIMSLIFSRISSFHATFVSLSYSRFEMNVKVKN